MDSAEVQAWQESIESAWSRISGSGTAVYDYGSGLIAWYIRTGDVLAIRQAVKEATWAINYYVPFANDTDICTSDQINIINPERIDGQYHVCGLSSEWWSLRYSMNHAFYMFFGWEQYIYQSWHQSQAVMRYISPTSCLIADFGARFNFGLRLIPTMMAYISEGTTKIDGGYGPGAGDPDFPTKLPMIIDCLDYNKFNDSSDWRYGLVGFKNTTVDIPGWLGYFPTFQLAVAADFLILYYQNIQADPRIPRQGPRPGDARPWEPYLFPMFTNTYGFLYSYYKNDTYKMYGLYSIVPEQMAGMIWIKKVWGEVYNANRHSFSYYLNGGAAEGLESTRPGAQIPSVSNTTDAVGNTRVTQIESPPRSASGPAGQSQISISHNLISNFLLLGIALFVSIHHEVLSLNKLPLFHSQLW